MRSRVPSFSFARTTILTSVFAVLILAGCSDTETVSRPENSKPDRILIQPPGADQVSRLPPGEWTNYPPNQTIQEAQHHMVIDSAGGWNFDVVALSLDGRTPIPHLTCNDTLAAVSNPLAFSGVSAPGDTGAIYSGDWHQGNQHGILIRGFYILNVLDPCNAAARHEVVMWPDSIPPAPPWLLKSRFVVASRMMIFQGGKQ